MTRCKSQGETQAAPAKAGPGDRCARDGDARSAGVGQAFVPRQALTNLHAAKADVGGVRRQRITPDAHTRQRNRKLGIGGVAYEVDAPTGRAACRRMEVCIKLHTAADIQGNRKIEIAQPKSGCGVDPLGHRQATRPGVGDCDGHTLRMT